MTVYNYGSYEIKGKTALTLQGPLLLSALCLIFWLFFAVDTHFLFENEI